MNENSVVRVKLELELIEGKHFHLPPKTLPSNPDYNALLEQSATTAFIYWLDSWCKKKSINVDIVEYIQAKVMNDD